MSLPRPAVGDVVQIKVTGMLDSQVCMNTFLYSVSTGAGTTGYPDILECTQALGDNLWDDPANGMNLFVSGAVGNVQYTGQIVHPTRSILVSCDPTANPSGTAAQPAVPSGAALVIRRKGNIANRHNQGRIYVFGCTAGDVAGSIWVNPTTGAAAAFVANLLISTVDVPKGANHTIFIPILAPNGAFTPIVPIQTGFVDNVVRYQRRREVGRGI